jgi:hypothetical protein
MRLLSLLLALLMGWASPRCFADTATSALGALKLIPKDKAARLARIEARDGTPDPDRWYLIVHDPAEQNGLHEFVVAGKEIVASRAMSQFAETIKAEDVIGKEGVKIDSDKVAKLARQYGQANNAAISKINYELTKDGAGATPVWKVSCLDENGNRVGELTVTAGKGKVISHEGFAVEPPPVTTAEQKKRTPSPKFDVYAESQVAPDARVTPAPRLPAPAADDDEDNRGRRRYYRDYDDDRRSNPVGNAARSVGRTIRRLLPF